MTRIAWSQLMRLGYLQVGLAPVVFWDLTPAEFMLIAGMDRSPGALSRAGFLDLAARYPDKPRSDGADLE